MYDEDSCGFELMCSQDEKEVFESVPKGSEFKFKVRGKSSLRKICYKFSKDTTLPCTKSVGGTLYS